MSLSELEMIFLERPISFFSNIPRDRRWWWVLLIVNLVGSVYGFYWYRYQLAETPLRFWILVPDSPGSTLLFSFVLIGLLLGRQNQWLAAFAFASIMKYGLWTVLVLGGNAVARGVLDFESFHLSLSHFGMFLEGFLFARVYRPDLRPVLLAGAWLALQDFVDYRLWDLHPTLPDGVTQAGAETIAVWLSIVAFVILTYSALTRSKTSSQIHRRAD